MEGLVPKLTLEEITLRRVAIHLWCESVTLAEIRRGAIHLWCDSVTLAEIKQFTTYESQREIAKRMIHMVKDKVSRLVLPDIMRERMTHLVRPLGREILRWRLSHAYVFYDSNECLDMHILENVCWTCIGTVDYQKTAERLVCLETLDVVKRFRLACFYCFEDDIPILWEELPQMYKSRFDVRPELSDYGNHLEYYWASVLKGEKIDKYYILRGSFRKAFSPHEAFFRYSACEGSEAATKYFFHKLSNEDRDNALYRAVCDLLERLYLQPGMQIKHRPDLLGYLLSSMTHERQKQVFKELPSSCLMFFLDWPWQDLFLDVVNHIWKFVLSRRQYADLLNRLNHSIFFSGYYFPDLIQNFFISSSKEVRTFFPQCFDGNQTLIGFKLFEIFIDLEDAETIKVVLKDFSPGDRLHLFQNRGFFHLFNDLIRADQWYFVDMCIGEDVLSKRERGFLKTMYMYFCKNEGKSKHLFEWLDSTSVNTNNTIEDEMVTKAKRLTSEEGEHDSTKKSKTH